MQLIDRDKLKSALNNEIISHVLAIFMTDIIARE